MEVEPIKQMKNLKGKSEMQAPVSLWVYGTNDLTLLAANSVLLLSVSLIKRTASSLNSLVNVCLFVIVTPIVSLSTI